MDPNTPTTHPALSPQERQDRNKALLLEVLKTTGAIRASVHYSGEGDSGFADETLGFDAADAPVDLSTKVSMFVEHSQYVNDQWQTAIVQEERSLEDALTDFAMEAITTHHGGWENNDGGAGEVIFDCVEETVHIEHNDYYTESTYTETIL